jgi:predicted GNAT family acetyltransferase
MSEDTSGSDIQVSIHPAEGHFAITVDGKPAGLAEYIEETGHRTFVHTEVDDAFAGQGLAGILVRQALDTTREDGLRIRATCTYVRKFLAEHHDWDDIVDSGTAEN